MRLNSIDQEAAESSVWVIFITELFETLALLPQLMQHSAKQIWTNIIDWDTRLTAWRYRPEQRKAWSLFSRLGDGWLYALWFLFQRNRGEYSAANHMAIACFLAWGVCSALKIAIRRRRPNQNPHYSRRSIRRSIVRKLGSWSFPSQHAAVAVAFAFTLWPNPGAGGLAVVICAARVLGGAHYVGDVLVGALVGLLAGRLA